MYNCPYCYGSLDTGGNCTNPNCPSNQPVEYSDGVEIQLKKRTNEERIIYMLEQIIIKLTSIEYNVRRNE